MRLPTVFALAILLCLPLGCKKEKTDSGKKVAAPEVGASVGRTGGDGVHPDDFRCDSIASQSSVSVALGRDVVVESSPFEPPQGLARPCNYTAIVVAPAPTTEEDKPEPASAIDAGPAPAQPTWSFDLDCRKAALKNGRASIAQYKAEGSASVSVGRDSVDHRDVALLFVDNDTPCLARVLGPGKENRVAIAKLVEKGLVPKTAPVLRTSVR